MTRDRTCPTRRSGWMSRGRWSSNSMPSSSYACVTYTGYRNEQVPSNLSIELSYPRRIDHMEDGLQGIHQHERWLPFSALSGWVAHR